MSLSNELLKSLNTTEEVLSQQLMRDVKEIFDIMVGLEYLLHLPIQIDPVSNFKDCISSLVGMAGTYNGLVSLHMPSNLAVKVTSFMLGTEVTDIDDDVNDAMGEIVNMIAGSFKQHLSVSGLDTHLSTPSIIHGKEYVITLGNNPDQIAVRFATNDDWFMVAVAFECADHARQSADHPISVHRGVTYMESDVSQEDGAEVGTGSVGCITGKEGE